MGDHTPTPWTVTGHEHGIYPIWAKCGPLDVQPAVAHGLSDAEFIIKAVNNHDVLVKALEEIIKIITYGGRERASQAYKIAKDAIDHVGGPGQWPNV